MTNEPMPDPVVPAQAPDVTVPGMSRRELLKKAGWVVPAIAVLPLTPTSAHATWYGHASPAGRKSDGHSASSSPSWHTPSSGGSSGHNPGWGKSSGDKSGWGKPGGDEASSGKSSDGYDEGSGGPDWKGSHDKNGGGGLGRLLRHILGQLGWR